MEGEDCTLVRHAQKVPMKPPDLRAHQYHLMCQGCSGTNVLTTEVSVRLGIAHVYNFDSHHAPRTVPAPRWLLQPLLPSWMHLSKP
jgi:hypothetical protein